MSKKIVVIGAGISGLTAAYKLKQRGFQVTLLESKPRAGGVINSSVVDGFMYETGSNSVMVQSQKTLDFISELGLDAELVHALPTAKKRFFARDSKICEVPMNPLKMLFSRLFTIAGKFALLKDFRTPSFLPDEDPSIEEFTIRRLGQEAYDYGMNPFVAGVYGGDPSKLSLRYALPAFWNLDQKYGSIIRGMFKRRKEKKEMGDVFKPAMISFKKGLVELTDKLAEELKDGLVVGANIVSVDYDMGSWRLCWTTPNGEDCDEFDAMFLAVPPRAIEKLPLPGSLEQTLAPLAQIEYAPIASVALGFNKSDILHKLDGFGVLLPEKEKEFKMLGALFSSSIFEGRAPEGKALITCYMGGKRQPELVPLDDAELVNAAIKDLQKLIGLKGNPVFKHVTRWHRGIAQYNIGHGEILEAIDEFEKEFPSVKLIGSYRGGVGVSSCLESALAAAEAF